jgi:hypothetical protein
MALPMTVKFETAPTESEKGPVSLGGVEDLPGKLNCLRSVKMGVLPSTPFYQRYHFSDLKARAQIEIGRSDMALIYASGLA